MKSRVVLSLLSAAWAADWSWPEDDAWFTQNEVATVCETGTSQSPIDIPPYCLDHMTTRTGDDVIAANWGVLSEVVHSHGIKAQVPSNGPFTTRMRGQLYTLQQCHFHYGSEHTFAGDQHNLCMHCVHTSDTNNGRYGVLGFTWVISNYDTSDPFLDQFQAGLDSPEDVTTLSDIDMTLVLNDQDMSEYVEYDGGLTTPPCTEAVDWHVLTNPRPISQSMYDAFVAGTGSFDADADGTFGNARTTQQLNGRVPTGCTWSAGSDGQSEEGEGGPISDGFHLTPLFSLPLLSLAFLL